MTDKDPECYEFGAFRLMVRSGDLTYAQRPVKIKPKTAEVLTALLRNAGDLVLRDTLMDLVWEDVNVEEGNLTNAISELRRIFRERGTAYIRTKARKGYCFEGLVTECTDVVHAIVDGYISRHGFFEDYTERFS